jgi:hypothetical protein
MQCQPILRVDTIHQPFKPGHNLFHLILSALADRSMQMMPLYKHISKQRWLSSPATDEVVCLFAMKQVQPWTTSPASHGYSKPTNQQEFLQNNCGHNLTPVVRPHRHNIGLSIHSYFRPAIHSGALIYGPLPSPPTDTPG